jgi:Leucine-rich repeat (LRR) protein
MSLSATFKKIDNLKKDLLESYTPENMNRITLILIDWYKKRKFPILQKVADLIDPKIPILIKEDGKGFSRLMMLYHPDRLSFHLNEIENLANENDYEALSEYSHILRLVHLEEMENMLNNFEDIDYSPVYEWDLNQGGFSFVADRKPKANFNTRKIACNFYDAVKKRVFENPDQEYPPYYLEDIEEFELSSSDIKELDGVENCIHVKSMDLSDNMISDIFPLLNLPLLEELNLSDNRIYDIDALSNLSKLRILYLANNQVDDISPLGELESLEYVDLEGNPVSEEQIKKLIDAGVEVIG